MFEKIKYMWNIVCAEKCGQKGIKALKEGEYDLARSCSTKAIGNYRKALKLNDKFKDSLEDKSSIQKIITSIEEVISLSERGKTIEDVVHLSSSLHPVGCNPNNYLANRMIDMYRIASDRLDMSPKVIKMIYINNKSVPQELGETMNQYLEGKLSKEETKTRLQELKSRTNDHFEELGIDPNKDNMPIAVLLDTLNKAPK